MMTSKKRLIDANPIVKFILDGLNNPNKLKAFGHDAIEILTEIEFAPTVDAVEVVHGQWIKKKLVMCEPYYLCSVCCKLHDQDYNFCNNCGAKMDGGNEDGNL